jgi:hypothetical protein
MLSCNDGDDRSYGSGSDNGSLLSDFDYCQMMRTVLIYRSPTSWEPQEEGMMSTATVFPQ